MKKISAKPIIMSALAAIAFGTVTVGTTFALFTDKAETKISVKAGIVDLESEVKLVSYENSGSLTNASKTFTDETSYETETGTKFTLTGANLAIEKMIPGDKITLDVKLVNKSNVKTKYRLAVKHNNGDLVPALLTKVENAKTVWTELDAVAEANLAQGVAIETARVTIEFVEHDQGVLANNDATAIDNKYMGKTAEYSLGYEMVQGNAQVIDEYMSLNGYTISAPEGTQAGQAYEFEETIGGGLATFKGTTQDDSDVKLVAEENTSGNFEFSGADGTKTYELNATNTAGNVNVSLFVGKGYADVLAYHNGSPIQSTYNAETGYIAFVTDSFSPFSFAYFEEPVDYVTTATELREALLEGGDIYIGADFSFDEVMLLSKDTKIYGLGHELKGSQNRVFRVTNPNLKIEMYDLQMTSICTATSDVRGISFDDESKGSSLLLDKCSISAGFYVINAIPGADDLNITVRNGTVAAGWAAFNLYSNNSTINVINSELKGLNDKGENSWNNFNTITLDGNSLWNSANVGKFGSNNHINIENSTIFASSQSENAQYWIGIQYGAIGNTVVVDEKTKIIDVDGEDKSDLILLGYWCAYNSADKSWQYYENDSTITIGSTTIALEVETDEADETSAS